MEEIWKDIKGYEGYYQVSSLGRIRSIPRQTGKNYTSKYKVLTPNHVRGGYTQIGFTVNYKKTSMSIHRLVAQAFISNPNNKPEVHHINHIRDDNRAENLMWVEKDEQSDTHRRESISKSLYGNSRAIRKSVVINDIEYPSHRSAAKTLEIPSITIDKAVQNNQTSFKSKGKMFKLGLH